MGQLALIGLLSVRSDAQCYYGCQACSSACQKHFGWDNYCCYGDSCCCYSQPAQCAAHPSCPHNKCGGDANGDGKYGALQTCGGLKSNSSVLETGLVMVGDGVVHVYLRI